jgi:hypothetical protein
MNRFRVGDKILFGDGSYLRILEVARDKVTWESYSKNTLIEKPSSGIITTVDFAEKMLKHKKYTLIPGKKLIDDLITQIKNCI